ncbi:MAG: hypothetical protein U0269_09250 [Polyangiales bacterium]
MHVASLSSLRGAITALTLVGTLCVAQSAAAQDAGADAGADAAIPARACVASALGCQVAPIQFVKREGLPVEFDYDTSWIPAGSPVQVRLRAAFVGHTEIRAGGSLAASWPRAMSVAAPPGPAQSASIESDYGIVFRSSVRLHLVIGATTYDWEGNIPFVPQVDFRSTARGNFDPWGWARTSVRGSTMRQRIADVSLTDSLIPIPGISGGLSFAASASLETGYRSTRISFAPAPDAITESVERITLPFEGGPFVELAPRLEGLVDQSVTITVTPSLYVSLLGRRWDIPIVDVPVPINTPARPWLFDPQRVRFELPDIAPLPSVIEFGDVFVGESATRSVTIDNRGGATLDVLRSTDIDSAPFAWVEPRIAVPVRAMRAVEMRFAPSSEGAFETRVPLVTSDPDTPTVYVTARGRGVARPVVMDSGVVDASDASAPDSARDAARDAATSQFITGDGCACSTPARGRSRAPLAALTLAAAAALVARRRSRSDRTLAATDR